MTETRAEKAQRLVDEGRVQLVPTIPLHSQGIVRGDHEPYLVYLYPLGHFWCGCAWGRLHSYTDDLCAHALALRLAVERSRK